MKKRYIVLFAAAIIVYLAMKNGVYSKTLRIVKQGHFKAHPEKTIGRAFEKFFYETKWEWGDIPAEPELTRRGYTMVRFLGYWSGPTIDPYTEVVFYVKESTGEFGISSLRMDGTLYDEDTIAKFIDYIYSNQ